MATSRYERYQYIYGNTARAVEMPVLEPAEKQQSEVKKPAKAKVRSNQKVLEFSGRFAATVAVAVVSLVILCVTYLHGQYQLNNQLKAIASKRTALTTLVNENHAMASNLDKKVNYDEIKVYAQENLGMVMPSEENTIYYEGRSSDYVRQYAEIPAAK